MMKVYKRERAKVKVENKPRLNGLNIKLDPFSLIMDWLVDLLIKEVLCIPISGVRRLRCGLIC